MLKRSIVLFSFGVAAVLFGVTQTEAQPGGKGPKVGTDIKKLENDLAQLLDQVKETQAKLAKAKEAGGDKKDFFKDKGGFGGGFGKGGFGGGKGGFGKGGFGGFGKGGPEKLDPDTIKERYEYYKKLYDELPKEKGKGKGKGFEGKGKGPDEKGKGKDGKGKDQGQKGEKGPSGGNIEARIDRLIGELEALRSELRNAKGGDGKKGPDGKKFDGKKFDGKKKFGGEDE